ncbi:uncharacterized protein LOC110925093 [Helianthus annuus]|uniref:uncharacterized protein LOC110925093 n=1 Tax=Helianthus annuus TaxID=4232 RepID=UPI000B8FE62B|nr:uncharacterized protein LOC110925093 [Helianthus annuus]
MEDWREEAEKVELHGGDVEIMWDSKVGGKPNEFGGNSGSDSHISRFLGVSRKWRIGGRGDVKSGWIRGLKVNHKIDFLAIQETKLVDFSGFKLDKLWGNTPFCSEFVGSVGQSGGLLCLWDDGIFRFLSSTKQRNFLYIRGLIKGSNELLNIINVYAPQSGAAKNALWDELLAVMEGVSGKWVLLGDFNAVRDPSERRNSRFKVGCASRFNEFINQANLLEYEMKGKRVFNSWIEQPGYGEMVESVANQAIVYGPPDIRLIKKFTEIRKEIKAWRDDFCKNEKEELEKAIQESEETEKIMEDRELTEEEEWIYAENKKVVADISFKKIMDIRKRSRIKWALDGDENSKFFHTLVNNRKARNQIPGLNIDGT